MPITGLKSKWLSAYRYLSGSGIFWCQKLLEGVRFADGKFYEWSCVSDKDK